MARDRNTYAKRQRETGKKQKAAEKRARRQKKKEYATSGPDAPAETPPAISPGGE
jgi:sRNA-binding protein